MLHRLQPRQIPDSGTALSDKAIYANRNREVEFWEKFHHRHKQAFGEIKKKIQLEAKKSAEDLSLKRPKSEPKSQRGASDNLCKHLRRSRKLLAAVKQGGSYFQLLQEQEEQKNEKRRKKEERRRTDHHQSFVSDSEIENEEEEEENEEEEEERRSLNGGVSSSPWRQSHRRCGQRLRPFTPVHQSLTSAQPQQLSEEHVYRQLCCLCWLLEALTLERSGKFGAVASCWDARDPGRGRNTLRAVNREKLIQAKWERFICPPKSLHPVIRLSHITALTHKSSTLCDASSSVLTTSLPSNMSSCDIISTSEESERMSAVKSEADPPVSKYLQKLLDEVHQSVSKELYGSSTDCSSGTDMISFETLSAQYSTPDCTVTGKLESHTAKSSEPPLALPVFSHEKAAMLEKMKLTFKERAQELALSLIDTLDLQANKRWISGVQRYQSLSNMSASRCHSSSVPRVTSNPQVKESDTQDIPYSTHWLSELLSSLPAHTHSNRKLVCVLRKLKRYTLERTLRIRPHVFLRVLNSLQPWELCCPELCVAIEVVRENAVRMGIDEYDCWLSSKVEIPQSVKTSR